MTIRKRFASALGCALMVATMAGSASAAGYTQTNLVSNGAVTAANTDPHLINPWGISFFPGMSPFWVSDNNAGVATLYDGTGLPNPLIVDIPSPTDPTHGGATGAPTGQVANLSLFTSPSFPIFQNGSF
ncbi:MAG TPA: TIGR03118 family protein, partial [Candidatus Binatia bacterium]|nr:TIGR03118 family protein [Candidatus Binatia bacterium]